MDRKTLLLAAAAVPLGLAGGYAWSVATAPPPKAYVPPRPTIATIAASPDDYPAAVALGGDRDAGTRGVGQPSLQSIHPGDLTEKIVKLSGIFLLRDALDKLSRFAEPPSEEVGKGQVVAVVIGSRMDLLRLFEERYRLWEFSGLEIKLSQIVIRLKIIRLQGESLTKLLFRRLCFSGMKKARCQICSCCG